MLEIISRMVYEYCHEPQVLQNADFDLLESDLLDSLDFAQLFEEIEDRFGVEIYPTQYPADAFSTAAKLAAVVEELLKRNE